MLSSAISPFNNSPFAGQLRQPRAIVVLNDGQNNIPVLWEDLQVQTTTFYIADNYTVTIPLYGQNPILNLQYWSAITDLTVRIYIGFPANPNAYNIGDLTPFMTGTVDLMDIDPVSARVTLSGRDLTSKFIDNKITSLYSNQTASSIVTKIAESRGLSAQVTPTSGNVGRYFKNFISNAQNLSIKQITEWDLLTFLAQQSGYVVYVIDQTLYFQPAPINQPNPYVINFQPPQSPGGFPTFPGMDLHFKRSLTLAKDVIINVVVPTNPQTGKSFTKSAKYVRRPRGTANLPAPGGTTQTYNFIFAGLTQEQAQQQANTLAQNITLQEIVMSGTMPLDTTLIKGSQIQVKGTNTAFDQIYYLDLVTRHFNAATCFQSIVFKNISSDSIFQGS